MMAWKTLSKKNILDSGKWLAVEDRTVMTPSGQVIDHWPWIITPNYVNILASTAEGKYLIFRQGKYGLEGESLAPVGGYIEPGEEALAAAQRELVEETGFRSEDWLHLGRYIVDPNRGVAMGDLYLARNAHQVTARNADDLEEQQLLFLERPELERALQSGQFKVLAWAANIAFALLFSE